MRPRVVGDVDAVRGKLGALALTQLAEHGKTRTGKDDLHDVVGAEERCDAGVPLARDELGAGHAREVGALRGVRIDDEHAALGVVDVLGEAQLTRLAIEDLGRVVVDVAGHEERGGRGCGQG